MFFHHMIMMLIIIVIIVVIIVASVVILHIYIWHYSAHCRIPGWSNSWRPPSAAEPLGSRHFRCQRHVDTSTFSLGI